MNEEQTLQEQGALSFSQFQEKIQILPLPEEKVKLSLEFMRQVLSFFNPPRFKDFWESKKICLPLFKEIKTSPERALLWNQYIEVSSEARQVKQVLDEQSAFAVEQIEIALSSIEKDVESIADFIDQTPSLLGPYFTSYLRKEEGNYHLIQKEIYILNILASKIQTFRKEVIGTEMRIRIKNQLFDRLSKIGDVVFPRKKGLIKALSSQFVEDVKKFVEREEKIKEYDKHGLLDAREEIKEFQDLAKRIQLDPKSFNQTRELLSQRWEALKQFEDVLREDFKKKAEIYQKNSQLVLDKISLLRDKCALENATWEDASKMVSEISHFMRNLELGRNEVRALKDEIQKAEAPLVERSNLEKQEREKKIEEMQRLKREKFEAFKKEIEEVTENSSNRSLEELSKLKDAFSKQILASSFSIAEREFLQQRLKLLRDKILDEKERAFASLSKEERLSLNRLNSILEDRKAQRAEIKQQLEIYRKELASTGFDFNKAIQAREQIEQEKERLAQVLAAVEEIEDQIAELQEAF